MTDPSRSPPEGLYAELLALSPDERTTFLEGVCAGNAVLRRHMETVLRTHGGAKGFTAAAATAAADGPTGPADPGGAPIRAADDGATATGASAPPASAPTGAATAGDGAFSVGPYRVVRTLGRGGMGTVYEAIDDRLGRRVALKAIRAERRLDPGAMSRLLREAKLLSSLRHAHICGIHDYLERDDGAYLVLEYVDGEPLDAARARLGFRQKLRVAEQIADALRAAHAAGVIHRDLKPDNVMVTPAGDAKVLDFGIARPSEPDGQVDGGIVHDGAASSSESWSFSGILLTSPGALVGTPAYMSPEQAEGAATTTASDMFGLGLLLQELFTGERSFERGEDVHELLGRVRRAEIRPMRGGERDIRRLVRDLTARRPADRPTAAQVVQRLRRLRTRPLRRAAVAAALVLAALAAAGVAKYTVDLNRERSEAVAARADAEELVEFMTEDLRNRLAPVGRLDVLDSVANRVIDYYDTRRAGDPDGLDDAQSLKRAKALTLLGETTLSRKDADLAAARRAFDAALAPLVGLERRDPGNGAVVKALGAVRYWHGNIAYQRGDLAGAQVEFEAYLELARRLVEIDGSNPAWLLELGYAHSNLVQLHRDRGDVAASRRALDASLEVKRRLVALPSTEGESQPGEWRRGLANGLTYLAGMRAEGGDVDGALETISEAIDLLAALVADFPRDADNRYRLGIASILRGEYQARAGRHAASLESFVAAQETLEALRALDPRNADWQRELATAHRRAGEAAAATGDQGRARAELAAGAELLAALVRRDPGHARWSEDLAETQVAAAKVATAQGARTDALALLAEAVAVYDRLVAQHTDPARRDVASLGAARTLVAAAGVHAAGGGVSEARAACEGAIDRLAAVASPKYVDRRDAVLAEALLRLDRVDEARPIVFRLAAAGACPAALRSLALEKGVEDPSWQPPP